MYVSLQWVSLVSQRYRPTRQYPAERARVQHGRKLAQPWTGVVHRVPQDMVHEWWANRWQSNTDRMLMAPCTSLRSCIKPDKMWTVANRFLTLKRQMHFGFKYKIRLTLFVFVLSSILHKQGSQGGDCHIINGLSHPQDDQMDYNESPTETCRNNFKKLHLLSPFPCFLLH